MAEDAASVPAKRTKAGQFAKGASGNRGGRAKGVPNHMTARARKILETHADEIMESVCREAIGGDMLAAKLLVERIYPARRGAPINIALPPIVAAADAIAAMKVVVESLAEGHLSPEEAAELASLVDAGRKTIETADHEARILELEAVRGS